MSLVLLGGVFCERFDRTDHDIERTFNATLRAKKYACSVRLIAKFFSAKCSSTVCA